jgi:hypothetical protein
MSTSTIVIEPNKLAPLSNAPGVGIPTISFEDKYCRGLYDGRILDLKADLDNVA